jgi:hypothetical protein
VRWIILGTLLTMACFAGVAAAFGGDIGEGSDWSIAAANLAILPITLGIAAGVIRPRGVDVDRALHLTVSGWVAVPVLAATYAGLSALLGGWWGAAAVGAAAWPVGLLARRVADWVVYRGRPDSRAATGRMLARLGQLTPSASVPAIVLDAAVDSVHLDAGRIWPCFIAKLRDVAALWATISTKHAKPMPSTFGTSPQVIPSGRPTGGKPPCTEPITATPCVEASRAPDKMIDKITATTAPGTLGRNRLNPRIMPNVPRAKATVQPLASPRCVIVDHCCSNQFHAPFGTPNMSGICPAKTWMPTPVRKPISTEALRKSPKNPSRNNLATINRPAQTSATRLDQATHSTEFGVRPAMPRDASPAAKMAAVAESAPTTSSRDEPSSANTMVGKMTLYKPVTTGVWEIEVYPMHSGIATAANVIPATTSLDSQLRRYP